MNTIDGGNNNNSNSSNNKISGLGATATANAAGTMLHDAAALPSQFVLSMKTLFDILDDQQTGYVKFSDIEKGWQDERCIELLRKVTPASGLLSFERFCGGLKLCLLKNQQEPAVVVAPTIGGGSGGGGGGGGVAAVAAAVAPLHKPVNCSNPSTITTANNHNHNNHNNNHNNNNKPLGYYGSVKACKAPIKLAARPPSAPTLDIENPLPNIVWGNGVGGVGGAIGVGRSGVVRPSNMVASKSMPQLSPDSEESEGVLHGVGIGVYHSPPPPPKPPRAAAAAVKMQAANSHSHSSNANVTTATITTTATSGSINNHTSPLAAKTAPQSSSKAEIRNALQNWQMNILLSEMDTTNKVKHKLSSAAVTASPSSSSVAPTATVAPTSYVPAQFPYRRGCADGGSSSATESAGSVNGHATIPPPAKKLNAKRRDSRRHTLQNGIDYNVMMRRLKQLEDEREMLLLALNAVERARDCYVQQVAHVQEKIKYLGLMGHVEQWSEELQQERLNYQRARILEVNRCLAALAETCYPMHLNLAFSGESSKNAAAKAAFIMPTSQSTKICDADVVY